jgi:hypothetical protein
MAQRNGVGMFLREVMNRLREVLMFPGFLLIGDSAGHIVAET